MSFPSVARRTLASCTWAHFCPFCWSDYRARCLARAPRSEVHTNYKTPAHPSINPREPSCSQYSKLNSSRILCASSLLDQPRALLGQYFLQTNEIKTPLAPSSRCLGCLASCGGVRASKPFARLERFFQDFAIQSHSH